MRFEKLDVKKVEQDLEELISDLHLKNISVSWIKDFTYNFDVPDREISKKYFNFLFNKLPRNINEKDFDRAVATFNNAWNVFPQKVLG